MPIWKMTIRGEGPYVGSPGYNTWHGFIDPDAAGVEAVLNEMSEALRLFYTGVRGLVPAAHSWTNVLEAIDLESGAGYSPPAWTVTGNASGTGTGYGPSGACVVAGWRTDVRARRGMGRTFVGPLDRSAIQTDGTLTPTALAAVIAAGTTNIAQPTNRTSFNFVVNSASSTEGYVIRRTRVRDVVANLSSRR